MEMIGLVDGDTILFIHKKSIFAHFLCAFRRFGPFPFHFVNTALFVFLGGCKSKIIITSVAKSVKAQKIQLPSFTNHFPRGLLLKHSISLFRCLFILLSCSTQPHVSPRWNSKVTK